MEITNKGLEQIERVADETRNVKLMFLIQILRELREVRQLLEIHQNPSDSSNDSAGCTDDSEDEHG